MTVLDVFAESTSEAQRVQAIRQQDARFQHAMRRELARIASDRGLKLIPSQAENTLPPPRDFILVASDGFTPSNRSGLQIVRDTCKKHRISREELCSPRRAKHLVFARQEASYLMSRETRLSLSQIGRMLGGRDHTTIIYAIRKHAERMEARALEAMSQ